MNETIAFMALSRMHHLSLLQARSLCEMAGSAQALIDHRRKLRELLPDVPDATAAALADSDEALARAEREYEYAQRKHIRCLSIADEAYPALLRECPDAPLVLYSLGNADLNARRIVSVVGTRRITPYGKDLCRHFISDLHAAYPDTLVVSGLAYGVDIHAHREALANDMATVGVLAHGLDRLYPSVHRTTAIEMLERGGLLTEYMSETRPDRGNFVRRNRIVAGMSAATVVVESAAKGGALITASLAAEYDREVCAFPGRTTDEFSAGCNKLIVRQQAHLVQTANDFFAAVGWPLPSDAQHKPAQGIQQELFPELSVEETAIVKSLNGCDSKAINQIVLDTDIPIHKLSAILFDLEMRGIVAVMGGARYRLLR